MTMTLEQVRNRLRGRGEFYRIDPCEERAMADAIDAHLLSQEAEISNLRDDRDSWLDQASQRLEDWDDMRRRAESAESRLAAAKAEIEQLQAGLAKHVNRVCELQSRLAVADALLSRCFVQIGELTKGLDPHDPIYVELQQLGLDWMQHNEADTAHLSENAHG